ncbi:MAG: hypothetical protein ACT4PO_05235 [Actinomycetota bacterium]
MGNDEVRIPGPALERLLDVRFVEALFGRRSRRFAAGATLPDGPLAFTSPNPPMPLSEAEELLVLSAVGGNTGWNFGIMRHERYAPHLSNYAGAAGGRAFPSAAGFHTSELFFTNDRGTFFVPTRDAGSIASPTDSVEDRLEAHRARIRRLSDRRVNIPAVEPYMEGHNTWIANCEGSTLFVPVGDLAQHEILNLCFYVQNGYCIYDDLSGVPIEGIDRFGDIVDLANPVPLSFLEEYSVTELCAELSTATFAGVLMLQALGLGGWMFDGIDTYTMLGASGDPDVPGLGFRYDTDDRWPLPNPTGLPGVFEAHCPPHYPDMRAAVESVAMRKFGSGGPYHGDTPGPWKDTRTVRSSVLVHDEQFIDCVSTMAQHVFDTCGRFPARFPSVYALMYLQAHHLELEFYDRFFEPGAYLPTHADHMALWHAEPG